jgi:hypothetical protein
MKLLTILIVSACYVMTTPPPVQAQSLTPTEQAEIVAALQTLLQAEHYSSERATQYDQALDALPLTSPRHDASVFAIDVHTHLQSVLRDGHLGVYDPQRTRQIFGSAEFSEPQTHTPEHQNTPLIAALEEGVKLMVMPNFSTATYTRPALVEAFSELQPMDALILDLRGNRGGDAQVFRWMASCLFAEPTPIFAIDWRNGDSVRVTSRTSQPDPACLAASNTPLIILVDNMTASTAELVPFILRNRGRATIIGEATYGASHAAEFYELPHGFGAMIPIGRTYDPETGEDWEGRGTPVDIPVSPEDAMDTAQAIARGHAQCLSLILTLPGFACEVQP